MASISLNPAPGLYQETSKTVSMTASDYQTILVSTQSQPVFTKNIAYDQFNNPFISVVEDGRGNVLFDGGFPKFYNNSWNSATTFAQLSNSHKILYNALMWMATNNAPGTPKKVLIYGDCPTGTDDGYAVKGTREQDFNTTLRGICAVAGFTPTFIDVTDYGLSSTIPYSLMAEHSSMIIVGSYRDVSNRLSAASIANIDAFRKAGGGIMLTTDHNVYQATVNAVAALFGASFSGNVDRSPVSVDYLVATYGPHPLWANMTGNVYAGPSEGIVNVPANVPFDPATQTITISGAGYRTIYVTVQSGNGVVSAQMYSYALQVPDPVSFTVPLPSNTIFKLADFPFEVTRMNSEDTRGFAIVNGTPIGQFTRTLIGNTQKTWFAQTLKPIVLNMGETNDVSVSVNYPISYAKNSAIQAGAVNITSPLPAERWGSIQQYELAGVKSKGKALAAFRSQQGLGFSPVIGKALRMLNRYYGTTTVTPEERQIVTGANGVIGFGYERRSVSGGTYGSISSTVNIFADLSIGHFSNHTVDGQNRTTVSFIRQGGEAQQQTSYNGRRFRVLDATGTIVFDKPFTAMLSFTDQGGALGATITFASDRYIFASGTTWRLQVQ